MSKPLRRLLRLPWEVAPADREPIDPVDRRILAALSVEAGLASDFRRQPPDTLVQSIALPTVMFMARNRLPGYVDRNPWVTRLTDTERAGLRKWFEFTHDQHSMLLLSFR